MTNRLIIHLPTESHTYDSDNIDVLVTLSNFCKEQLGAYNSTENINELTVDELSKEMSDKFYSLVFELDLA